MPCQSHLDPTYDQEGAKQIENPAKALYQGSTCEDQRSTHDQCSDDTPEKHSVLIQCWNAKGREDHCNHEDIVQAERFFDHITCKEKNCRGSAVRLALGEVKPEPVVLVCKIDEDIESERNTDPSLSREPCGGTPRDPGRAAQV